MVLLFKHIKTLVQVRAKPLTFLAGTGMQDLPCLNDAYLKVADGKIADFGPMDQCPAEGNMEVIDASGRLLLPAWCDAHTHLVYAGDREDEFVDRIRGLSYEEIARRGGGILNSARRLQAATEQELFEQSWQRLEEVIRLGTGAIEIKSGYGLSAAAELKMLRVIRRLREAAPIPIRATFLAAHALPTAYRQDKAGFLDLMVKEVLPIVAKEQLADYIDVFCEKGYFSVSDMEYILGAARTYGLKPKVHVNQFNAIGGVPAAVRHDALSVDHLEVLEEEDLAALQHSTTMPVALPACSYFLSIPYTPARRIIDAGLPLALATDYNPGSAPTGNMNFVLSAACIKMRMTPEEAINAATVNGAYAMELAQEVGTISIGKRANLILTKPVKAYRSLVYRFGSNQIEQVFVNGWRATAGASYSLSS